jgi:hypothetical protein
MKHPLHAHSLEILEARIAPASAIATARFIPAVVGGATLLQAGEGLGTAFENSGTYLLYVEKGQALVFTTDFNNNGAVDFNEITGIAAGDGLRLISFVNIYGDIVTNLKPDGTLSDSNNNASDDDPALKGDGRVLLNNRIEKIELRSLTADDLLDQDNDGDVDDIDVTYRLALSSYSVFGNILAGSGFGVPGDATSGLIIDDAGTGLQQAIFGSAAGQDYFYAFKPSIAEIRTGTAASGEFFSFGVSSFRDTSGLLVNFLPPSGQAGGDIAYVRGATTALTFNIDGLYTGSGGLGARGGDILNVTLNNDTAGGYTILAGNGGRGLSGGQGGSIKDFADLGSDTGRIIIQSGTGGTGTTGAGGNSGSLGFGTMNLSGGLSITLGDGGDGFRAGGQGASLTNAVITTPEGAVPYGATIVASTHDGPHDPVTGRLIKDPAAPGVIGRSFMVDFDRDGIGDMVYTSRAPDQLVVDFGDGLGGFRTADTALPGVYPGFATRIYLPSQNVGDPLAVGDFNGDGFLDIVTASNASGSFGTILVHLAKTEDINQDGVLTEEEDLDADGQIDFLGFHTPRRTVLPALHRGDSTGDPLIDLVLQSQYAYMRSAVPVTDIEVGDFDGDGFTDIALTATYTAKVTLQPVQVAMFLTPNIENGRPTGEFYPNVGTKATANPPTAANPLVPFYPLGVGSFAVIEATAKSIFADHDVIMGQVVDEGFFANFFTELDNFAPSLLGPAFIDHLLPRVDTNRVGGQVATTSVTILDITFHDSNLDGLTDFVALTREPANFGVAMLGNGLTFDTFITGDGEDQSGVFFPTLNPIFPQAVAVRNFDFDLDGVFDDVAVLTIGGNIPAYIVRLMDVADAPPALGLNGLTTAGLLPSFFAVGNPTSVVTAFDIYFPNTNTFPTLAGTLTAMPTLSDTTTANIIEALNAFGGSFVFEAEHYIEISAGNGGSSLIGRGGNGGSLGDQLSQVDGIDPFTGLPVVNLIGTISITLPANRQYAGEVRLSGGDGGNGFTSGGHGGEVKGTSVRFAIGTASYHTNVFATGGNGGFGVSGPGGNGGSLTANSFELGYLMTGGNGGRGVVGGNGGSIIGNGQGVSYDARNLELILNAGHGGDGTRRGGAGGSVIDYHGQFDLVFAGAAAGVFYVRAGDGGQSVSGAGGRGGDVLNASPVRGINNLAGDIFLQAGDGGNGKKGGDGGSIRDFANRPSTADNPAVLSFLAGRGGDGTTGKGGNGGSLSGIDTPSVGKPNPLTPVLLDEDGNPLLIYTFNRFLAGAGGDSFGKVGGNGGSLGSIQTSNSENPVVMAAGAGGKGFVRGGAGGDVRDMKLTLASTNFAKALIVAGQGGDAGAWAVNPLDPTGDQDNKFFGKKVGFGGQGGSIINFRQEGVINARVDLIAGNGGDTINYGTVADKKNFVGVGGSILNTFISGSAGNIDPQVRLKAYYDIKADQTMGDFIDSQLRNPLVPGAITDNVGMVGVVAGAAGRLKSVAVGYDDTTTGDPADPNQIIFRSKPATGGKNGNVINFTARNIASMVAGSVDRIAAVQVVGGINLTGGGVVGKDLSPIVEPGPYRDQDNNIVPEPVLDGRLVNGALVYAKFKPKSATDKLPLGKVFKLGGGAPV